MRRPNRRIFTLIEMIAVIAVTALVIAVTAVSLRKDRSQTAGREAMREFELFCAKVRAQVLQDGRARKLELDPGTGEISAVILPPGPENASCRAEELDGPAEPWVVLEVIEVEDEGVGPETEAPSPQRWQFPQALQAEFRMDALARLADGENLELWRYERDGSARLNEALIVYSREAAWSFTVAEFSGRTVCFDRDISQDDDAAENVLKVYR